MQIVVFEDHHTPQLYPVTFARAAYKISCAGRRLCEWLEDTGATVRGIVRPHLVELQKAGMPSFTKEIKQPGYMLVNARAVPSVACYELIQQLLKDGTPCRVMHHDVVVAAVMPEEAPLPPANLSYDNLEDFMQYAGVPSLPQHEATLPLFEYPHDIVRYNLEIINDNLNYRIKHGDYQEIADGVFTAGSVSLGEHIVTDTSDGPVVIEDGAAIGPFCYLSGPAHIGRKSRVIEHSAIKDAVSLGHTTKIGGEVEASVVEPYTNKQHYGFLGHSYLGSWINLGAGTCNSDLKNTYGTVNMEYRGEKVATNMQFVGCIMGDYSKSAINTGIFTGKVIGVCSMMYGFVTTNVPSFVNYARLFGQVTELPPEVMIATQQRMFSRRNVEARPCDAQLIHDMYLLTRHERQLAGEPLSL